MKLKIDLKRDRYETMYNNSQYNHEEHTVRVWNQFNPEYYEFYNEQSALEFISIVSKCNESGLYNLLTDHDFYIILEDLRNQLVDEWSAKNGKVQFMELRIDRRCKTTYNNNGHKIEKHIVRVYNEYNVEYEFYNEDSALDFIDIVSKFNKRGFYDKLTGYEFDMKLDSLRNQILNNFYLSQHNEVSQWN